MTMNRIAICISGQVRNDDAAFKVATDSLAKYDVDIYISVWKRRGTKNFSGFNSHGHLSRMLGRNIVYSIPENWVENMNEVFPESAQMFPSLGEVTEESIRKYFPNSVIDIEDEEIDFSFPHQGGNSFRMLYKIWRCDSLMRKTEAARGNQYDTVVRMRPDIALDFDRIFKLRTKEGELISMKTRPVEAKHLGDMYWIGTSKSAELMAGGFARAIDARTGKWRNIHTELYDHAIASGLELKPLHLMTQNVREFANFDSDYNRSVQANFVNFVRNRRMNVEAAGGEPFCAIVERFLSIALLEIEGGGGKTDYIKLIDDVSKFSEKNTEHADNAYLMTVLHLVNASSCNLNLRFESLIFFLKAYLAKNRKAKLTFYIANLVDIFAEHKTSLLSLLYGFVQQKEMKNRISSRLPDFWWDQFEKQSKVKESEIIECLLENDPFCNWLFAGDLSGSEQPFLALYEKRAEIGIFNEFHTRKAARLRETTSMSNLE